MGGGGGKVGGGGRGSVAWGVLYLSHHVGSSQGYPERGLCFTYPSFADFSTAYYS